MVRLLLLCTGSNQKAIRRKAPHGYNAISHERTRNDRVPNRHHHDISVVMPNISKHTLAV